MRNTKPIAAAIVLSVATGFAAAQGQAPAAPAGGQGGGQGRAGGGGGQAPAPAQAPARGVTVNQNIVQKATAKITGGDTISGTVEFNEYNVSNDGLIQVVYNLQGLPPGMHGVHVHSVGRCEPPFASANGLFDPGPASNTDADMNHPFHAGGGPHHSSEPGHVSDGYQRSGRWRRHSDRLRRHRQVIIGLHRAWALSL